jgi:hypothetical protein
MEIDHFENERPYMILQELVLHHLHIWAHELEILKTCHARYYTVDLQCSKIEAPRHHIGLGVQMQKP